MVDTELSNAYFQWMCQLIYNKTYQGGASYWLLLQYLHHIDFYAVLPMDENRTSDGINLRYRFGYERHYSDPEVATCLDHRPCSILEMMVALALRIEEDIMNDPEIGDRTSVWFWDMISNLGLLCMDDEHFDEEMTHDILLLFLERKYQRNGQGGLFKIEPCEQDMRNVEIWWQMNWYLVYLSEGEQNNE